MPFTQDEGRKQWPFQSLKRRHHRVTSLQHGLPDYISKVCKEDGPETRIPETACWKISRRTPRSFVWGQLEGGLQ